MVMASGRFGVWRLARGSPLIHFSAAQAFTPGKVKYQFCGISPRRKRLGYGKVRCEIRMGRRFQSADKPAHFKTAVSIDLERGGAGNDLDDFAGDGRLAHAVHVEGQCRD